MTGVRGKQVSVLIDRNKRSMAKRDVKQDLTWLFAKHIMLLVSKYIKFQTLMNGIFYIKIAAI